MKQLTILGSTGSIGCSTLDVVRHNPEHFRVVALVAGKNVTRMVEQCLEFSPRYAVMDDEASAKLLKTMLHKHKSALGSSYTQKNEETPLCGTSSFIVISVI